MRAYFFALILTTGVCQSLFADTETISVFGINSKGTGLNGNNAVIGEVDAASRPGKPSFDDPDYSHEQVVPVQVYAGPSVDAPNSSFVINGEHALQVASVMIATTGEDAGIEGVAPQADLHAGADLLNNGDVSTAIAINRIAQVNNMRAINLSIGRAAQGGLESPDGNAHLTQMIDWSADQQDVLYVVSGATNSRPFAIPQDNYNGITVGSSRRFGGVQEGYFREASPDTFTGFDPSGARTAVDLIAPGEDIQVAFPDNGQGSTRVPALQHHT